MLDLIDGIRSAPCEEVVPTTLMPRASTAGEHDGLAR
jgi:hypothetical protein